jgi:2-phospho-L-lactate/phosphoenolpyruvate guanylyltransferase
VNVVLVPIKALAWGKSRLSSLLSDSARHALSQAMLTDVVTSAQQAALVDRVVVVTSDPTLLALARRLGAAAVDEGYPRGINGAVAMGTDFCIDQGATALLVLLADLPLVTAAEIDSLFRQTNGHPQVIVVPCKEGDGTNAVLRVPPLVVPPCFVGGPSLQAYQTTAAQHGIACYVIESPGIAFDLDSVEDLKKFGTQKTHTHTAHVLHELTVSPQVVSKT